MRFVDEARITVTAGKGGHGCVSFRREKFVPRGGPDGGNGGDGGSVYLEADSRILTLQDFRLRRHYEAGNGQPGQGSQRNGKKGADLTLFLPPGTQVFVNGRLHADLCQPGEPVLVASGGRGGKGNEHFKSATMRAPRFAQPGEPGEELELLLSLKILADAGIIGLPNAGKSTLISRLSAARPRIAPYPFTTLTPNLGVMIDEYDPDRRMVLADIPGLVEGAHSGLGLGQRFLKHVERTRFLVHVLAADEIFPAMAAADADKGQADDLPMPDQPFAGFDLINEELRCFDQTLAERPQIEVISKIDLLAESQLTSLRELAAGRGVFLVSSHTGDGLPELMAALWQLMEKQARHEPLDRVEQLSENDSDDEFAEIEVIYTNE